MKKLRDIWKEVGGKEGTKVRFSNWDHRTLYFEIKGVDEKTHQIYGILNTGEQMSYPDESDHWEIFDDSREYGARTT